MVEPVRHRRTKGAETDMFEPKATASHLDSTHRVVSLQCNGSSAIGSKAGSRRPSAQACYEFTQRAPDRSCRRRIFVTQNSKVWGCWPRKRRPAAVSSRLYQLGTGRDWP